MFLLQVWVRGTNSQAGISKKRDRRKQSYDLALLRNLRMPFDGILFPQVRQPCALPLKSSFLPQLGRWISWFGKVWISCRERMSLRSLPWTLLLSNKMQEMDTVWSVGVAVILLRHLISHLLSPPACLGEDGILSVCLSEQSQGNTHTYSREQK